jgi:hypothetical protein
MVQNLLLKLWRDDAGALLTTEWLMVATILIVGVITGFIAVRQAVLARAFDLASPALGGGQSYTFTGQANCAASTGGSSFTITGGDSFVVRSTAATPGGVSAHACD